MKIAVISKTRLTISEPFRGGLEAFTHTICKQYIKNGHQVTLYAQASSDPSLNIKSFYGPEYRNDKNFEIYENDEYVSILRDIEQNDFDIVHNNSTHELPIIWGATASIPVVTTLHTPPISKLKAAISMASHSNNLRFVTISQSFKETWQPYIRSNSTVIYNGIDREKWPLVRRSKDHLLWFGRMVPAKGLDIALDVAHVVGMPLRFAGPLDDKEYFDRQIKPRMTQSDVYVGHLEQSDILAEMHGAAAMINAVRWEEPFGLTNIEAMSAGVPVAGFNRGAFKELINTKSGVIAEGTTVRSLAEAVRSTMTLDSEVVRRQTERFSIETMTRQYIDCFKEMI